jgi:CHAD domain-containing protein
MTSTLDHGDRGWLDAGRETVDELASEVAERARAIDGDGDVDAIHDMRTATRRLRTAISLYGDESPKKDREPVEDELKRVAQRLGDVRDLDVLLKALDDDGDADGHGLSPLRRAWRNERRSTARRLAAELSRRRFRRALRRARSLVRADSHADTIATRAPGLIWEQFGRVMALDIDPAADDPDRIHEARIAAKKLRYTLEAFEDALEPGAILIQEVTAVQDAAGDMHDAIVAGERAQKLLNKNHLRHRERSAIGAFIEAEGRRAQAQRPLIGKTLRTIRGRGFRDALGRAVAGMGHVTLA